MPIFRLFLHVFRSWNKELIHEIRHWNGPCQFSKLFRTVYRIKIIVTWDRRDNSERIIIKMREGYDGLDEKKSRNPIEENRDTIGLDMEIGNIYYCFT